MSGGASQFFSDGVPNHRRGVVSVVGSSIKSWFAARTASITTV